MQQRVLIIDEGSDRAATMAVGLRGAGYDVEIIGTCDVTELERYIADHHPDVLMYEDGNVVEVDHTQAVVNFA